LTSPYFFTPINWRVIFESMSILAIIATGIHYLLVAGEIDISFASVLELSAITAALSSPANTFYIIIVSLLAAIAVGVVNGFFTVKVGIPSFLTTLSTMVGVQGIVYLISNYRSVVLRDELLPQIFYGRFYGNIATSVYWMIGFFIFAGIILRYTKFGRWTYATGGNEKAARLMGIPTKMVKFKLFIISAFMAGVAGLIVASRSLAARPGMGENYLMPAIAAPILGGALLTGGRGSIVRTALGCLVLTVIINGVNLLGLEPAHQNIFMGVILVSALSIRALQKEDKEMSFRRIRKLFRR
jgi:ribose/xylose/arabinose/galactoside ABC-type transport system permease subunit